MWERDREWYGRRREGGSGEAWYSSDEMAAGVISKLRGPVWRARLLPHGSLHDSQTIAARLVLCWHGERVT